MAAVTQLRGVAIRSASILALLLAWELSARLNLTTQFHLPALSLVLQRLWTTALSGDLGLAAAQTLLRALSGFCLAAATGVLLGILTVRNRIIRWFFDPIVSLGLPLPKIAFLPLFVLWFGVYEQSKILMIAFSAVFPVIVSTAAGTENVDKHLIWSARSLGTTEREVFWQVILPAASPQIFTGLQIALPTSLIVTVVCEMALGGYGLGATIIGSMKMMDSTGSFAGIVAIALLGYGLIQILELVRRHLLGWHQESQR